MTLEEIQKYVHVLYSHKFKDRLLVQICQNVGLYGDRSQYLAIMLADELSGHWILLRLSTFRKIVKFVEAKGFREARRLTLFEQLRMDIKKVWNTWGK